MRSTDLYGLTLTGAEQAVAAYNRGVGDVLRLRRGSVEAVASSIVYDPTFALGHAALALLGHEFCAQADIPARIRDAKLHAGRSTERERSHVHAIVQHIKGDSAQLIRHLATYPTDALLLSTAVPTIAFAGATSVPQEAWDIVERARPAYGDDWWFLGLLAFMRQEQHRYDEAMDLSCRSLRDEPGAGHSAHARAHAHYETADHGAGLAWMDRWIQGDGADIDSISDSRGCRVARAVDGRPGRRTPSLRRPAAAGSAPDAGCWWTPGRCCGAGSCPPGRDVPDMSVVCAVTEDRILHRPATAFMAMHSAIALLSLGDVDALLGLQRWAAAHPDPVQVEVVSPLAGALAAMSAGQSVEGRGRARVAGGPDLAPWWVRRPARGGGGDPDPRAAPGRQVRRGAGTARHPAGPSALSPRRTLAGKLRRLGEVRGSGNGDLVARHARASPGEGAGPNRRPCRWGPPRWRRP